MASLITTNSTRNIKNYDHLFKLLLIGDSGVGKTCILFRFADDQFNASFISTIGIDFKIKTVNINGKRIKLQIWDTAGQERFHTITTSYYRGANGIMMVYDITNTKTFDSVTKWLSNVSDHASADVRKVLLGNKSDQEEKRMISTARGQEIAQANGIQFFETSAKDNVLITEAFLHLATEIFENRKCNIDDDSDITLPETPFNTNLGGFNDEFIDDNVSLNNYASKINDQFGGLRGSGCC